jgi:hypothetical protein
MTARPPPNEDTRDGESGGDEGVGKAAFMPRYRDALPRVREPWYADVQAALGIDWTDPPAAIHRVKYLLAAGKFATRLPSMPHVPEHGPDTGVGDRRRRHESRRNKRPTSKRRVLKPERELPPDHPRG